MDTSTGSEGTSENVAADAVAQLRDINLDNLTPHELVQVIRLSQQVIDLGGILAQDSRRELAKLGSPGSGTRGQQLAKIPDDEYERIKGESGLIRKALRRIRLEEQCAKYGWTKPGKVLP